MDKQRIIQYQSDAAGSCKTQGKNINDHFREVAKMIELDSGAKCYLALYQWHNFCFPVVKSRSDANSQVRKYTFDPTLERLVTSDEKSIEKTTQKLPK